MFYFWHSYQSFLRSWCSMEMWCLDDIRRDSWDWVGPLAWERACFNSPEWGGGSSPVETEPLQIVLLLLFLLLFRTRALMFDVDGHKEQRRDAMSPRTNLHVAGHLGVRLPATPPPQGALDDEELFIVEGSKNPRNLGLNPFRESPKNGPNPPRNRH